MFTHHAFRVPLSCWAELAWAGTRAVRDMMWPARVARQFGAVLGKRLPPCEGVSHHLGHSACAYFTSPFEHAAVLTVDGQGEDESGSLGEWRGTEYRHFRSIYSPDSIGILYGMVTDFLGMRAAWDEYKVMGMAAYGDPKRFTLAFRKLVTLRQDGRYRTHRTAMVFKPGYTEADIERALAAAGDTIQYRRSENIVAEAAELMARDKIIGWFQGRMEYGPRALGHRSILASPLKAEMKDAVNSRIKHREPFRPFRRGAPGVSKRVFQDRRAVTLHAVRPAGPRDCPGPDSCRRSPRDLPSPDGCRERRSDLSQPALGLRSKDRRPHSAEHVVQRRRRAYCPFSPECHRDVSANRA